MGESMRGTVRRAAMAWTGRRTARAAAVIVLMAALPAVAASPAQAAAGPLPGPISGLTLSGDLTAPTATWQAADGNGAPVTGYQVFMDGIEGWEIDDPTALSMRAVGGFHSTAGILLPGAHTLKLAAETAYGVGPESSLSWTTPDPASLDFPSAPTSLAVSVDAGGHTRVTWDAPTDDGGSPIIFYTVQIDSSTYHLPGGQTWYDATASDPGPHSVLVWPVNAKGSEALAADELTFPSPEVPSAVHDLRGDDGFAPSVSWTAPTDDGGAAVSGYRVRVDGGDWTDVGTSTTYSLSSSSAPAKHRVEVVAANANGDGVVGSTYATHYVPGVPATPLIDSISINGLVKWVPTDGLGNPITAYTLTVDGATTFTAPGDAKSFALTGISPGHHTLVMTATNVLGTGGASYAYPWQQVNKPTAAQNVRLVSDGLGHHYVTWDLPSDNGGDPDTGINYTIDGVLNPTLPSVPGHQQPQRTLNVSELSMQAHTVSVISANNAGSGPPVSLEVDPRLWPEAPDFTVTNDGFVRWAAGAGGEHPVTGYDVVVDGTFVVNDLAPTARSYALSGVGAGWHSVSVQVDTAVGSMGQSPKAYLQGPVPTLSDVRSYAGPDVGAVRVDWRGSDDPIGYDITIKRGSTTLVSRQVAAAPGTDHTDFTHLAHARLTVTVRARNGAGLGPAHTTYVTPWAVIPTRELLAPKSTHYRWHMRGTLQWGAGAFQGLLPGQRVSLWRRDGSHLVWVSRVVTTSQGAFAFPSLRVPKPTTFEVHFSAATVNGKHYAASTQVRKLS